MVKRDGRGEAPSKIGSSAVAKKAAKHALKSAAKHAAKSPAKHVAKHAKKHASKHAAKHASKHAAKKSATRKGESSQALEFPGSSFAVELAAAYHAMQRAGAVVCLLEEARGGDLRELLDRGVEVYRAATAADGSGERKLARAASGLLRAAEHLAMAGLYAAREKHLLNVPAPSVEAMERLRVEVARRLSRLHPEASGFAGHLCAVSTEVLKRAESADHDVHLAYELTTAADGLSIAVENWPAE